MPDQNEWWPAWALLMLPFLLGLFPLYRFVRKDVNWKAAWLTVLAFEILLAAAENYSLGRGHWVYNEARLLGPRFAGIPIEQPLLYCLFSPLIVISLFHMALRLAARHSRRPS